MIIDISNLPEDKVEFKSIIEKLHAYATELEQNTQNLQKALYRKRHSALGPGSEKPALCQESRWGPRGGNLLYAHQRGQSLWVGPQPLRVVSRDPLHPSAPTRILDLAGWDAFGESKKSLSPMP